MPLPSILVVDDDPQQLALFGLLLRHLLNLIVTAQSGDEALTILQEETPGVIVLDIAMPGMSGWTCCTLSARRHAWT